MSTVEFKGLVLAHKPREKHYLIMACSVFYQLCSLYLFLANIFQNREIPASLFLHVRLKNGFFVSIETQVRVQKFTSSLNDRKPGFKGSVAMRSCAVRSPGKSSLSGVCLLIEPTCRLHRCRHRCCKYF